MRVVPIHIIGKVSLHCTHALVDLQIHSFVYHAAPQALDEHVIAPVAPRPSMDNGSVKNGGVSGSCPVQLIDKKLHFRGKRLDAGFFVGLETTRGGSAV